LTLSLNIFVNNLPRKQNLDEYSSWNVIDAGDFITTIPFTNLVTVRPLF